MDIYKKYKNLFVATDVTSKKFYRSKYRVFNSASVAVEDLIQEMYIVLIEHIKKFKKEGLPPIDIFKLWNHALYWELYRKYMVAFNYVKKHTTIRLQCPNCCSPIRYDSVECKKCEKYVNLEFPFLNKIIEKNIEDTIQTSKWFGFCMIELKCILNDFEYNIIREVFENRRTLREIGKMYNFSYERIRQFLKEILDKIKRYLIFKQQILKKK